MNIPTARMVSKDHDAMHDAIEARALAWLIWLRSGEATVADVRAYRHWRARSPEHARAANELARLWQALGALAEIPGVRTSERRGEPDFPS